MNTEATEKMPITIFRHMFTLYPFKDKIINYEVFGSSLTVTQLMTNVSKFEHPTEVLCVFYDNDGNAANGFRLEGVHFLRYRFKAESEPADLVPMEIILNYNFDRITFLNAAALVPFIEGMQS